MYLQCLFRGGTKLTLEKVKFDVLGHKPVLRYHKSLGDSFLSVCTISGIQCVNDVKRLVIRHLCQKL